MQKFSFVAALSVIAFLGLSACNDRSVGTGQDAGTDAQIQPDSGSGERVIEYTVSYPSTADIEIGSTNVDLIEVHMKNLHPTETAMVSDLGLSMYHSPWWNIEDPVLWAGGIPLNAEFLNDPGNLDMVANLIVNQAIEPGETISFLLQGDVWDGVCFKFDVRFNEEDTYVLGSTTDMTYELRPSPQSAEVVNRLGVGRMMWLSEGPELLPEQQVPAGASNIPVLYFSLQSGVPVTVDSFVVQVQFTGNIGDYLSDLRLNWKNQNGDWIVISGPLSFPENCYGASACSLLFSDPFELGICAGDEFMITVDIASDAPAGVLRAILSGGSIAAYDADDLPLPTLDYNAYGNGQTVVQPGL